MKIKVSNVAFSKNEHLVNCLRNNFPDAIVNHEGIRFNGDSLIEYLSDADGAIVGLELIDDLVLEKLPKLKIIAKFGVGLDNIDLVACAKRNVVIGWTGGVNKRSVAEMALGFMLMLSRNLYSTSNLLKEGIWNKNGGFNVTGKTIGIIGLGNIGKELVRLLKPFDCKILVNDILEITSYADEHNLEVVSKDFLVRNADIISIHTPLTDITTNLIDFITIQKMKKTSILINTARGGIIDETALKEALKNNMIAGAALDVYNQEPPIDSELLVLPNLITTPHTGGNSYEAVVSMGESAISHLVKFSESENNFKL
jgi:phosphoglycerate dehydrogenase-like enzyme